MPESSLSLALPDLAQAVAYYLGYARSPASWSGWQASAPYVPTGPDTQLADVLTVVNAGLRQFYSHKPLPAEGGEGVMLAAVQPPHRWSFLCPERTLTTVPGAPDLQLPDDFKAFLGEMTYAAATPDGFAAVRKSTSGEVRRWNALANAGRGRPLWFGDVPRDSDGAQGQRYAVVFYPVPDQAYTLTYRSEIQPRALTAANPYPYGGMAHAETILEACLAVAESRMLDTGQQDPTAVHAALFRELLGASIAQDVRDHWAELAGYDGGTSDRARAVAASRNGSAAAKQRDPRLAGL